MRSEDRDRTPPDPQSLIARATWLVDQGRSDQSLPLYRRLLVLSAGLNPSVRCAYAVAIYNSLAQPDTIAGFACPVWRTSEVRVALMNECVAQLDSAIALADGARARSGFEARLAMMLTAWGFQWDAADELRRAAADDPGNVVLARMVGEHDAELRDPLHPGPDARLLAPGAAGQSPDRLGLGPP